MYGKLYRGFESLPLRSHDMAIPRDRCFDPQKLHWWFVTGALALVVSVVWAVWVDFDRPWRELQNQNHANQAALAHLSKLASAQHTEGGAPSLDPASPSSALNLPIVDFVSPRGVPGRHEIKQVILPDVRQRLGAHDAPTTERCTTCHVSIADQRLTAAGLSGLLEDALPAINNALERTGRSRIGYPAPPINQDPDGEAPPIGQVTEHWYELDESTRAFYLGRLLDVANTYLAIEDRHPISFTKPFTAHSDLGVFVSGSSAHPLSSMGCTACHGGNPQETDFILAAHRPNDPEQAKQWQGRYGGVRLGSATSTFEQVSRSWDQTMLPLRHVEAGCAGCHTRVSDVSRFGATGHGVYLDRGRHLASRLGCKNCHLLDDTLEADRVGPDLTRLATKTTPEFVKSWVLTPQEFRPSTRMPHFFDQENNRAESADALDPHPKMRVEAEVAAIVECLFAVSEPAEMRTPPVGVVGKASWGQALFRSVGCLGCHGSIAEFGRQWYVRRQGVSGGGRGSAAREYDIWRYEDRVRDAMRTYPDETDTIFEPAPLRTHPTKRADIRIFTRYAPELSRVGSKASRAWLFSWLTAPDRHAPDTRMPNPRLSPEEAAHVAEYLSSLDDYRPAPDDAGNTIAEQEISEELLSNMLGGRVRPGDSAAGAPQLTEALVVRLGASLGEDRVRSMATRLSAEQRGRVLLGSKLIGHYGCSACHRIPGFEDTPRPGPDLNDWGEKSISRLFFGYFEPGHDPVRRAHPGTFENVYPKDADRLIPRAGGTNPPAKVSRDRASFARHKLLNPRIWDRMMAKAPYEKTKMPNLYLASPDVDALVTYLLSRRTPRVSRKLLIDYDGTCAGMLADGRDMVRKLNCVGCHEIDGNVAVIRQYSPVAPNDLREFDDVPPSLRGVGAKLQSSWLYGFLDEAVTIRPWLSARMPNFHLEREDRLRLMRFFVGLGQDESRWLADRLKVIEEGDRADTNIGRDMGSFAAALSEIRDYATANLLIDPADNTKSLTSDDRRLVAKAEGLRRLYDVSFPAMDVPSPGTTADRIRDGEILFASLACTACHAFVDPEIPAETVHRMAPDLQPLYRRLRREWVYKWLERPGHIVEYTYMPDLFGDDVSSPFVGWSPADRAPLAARLRDPELLDDGQGAIEAMTDFLFDAGPRWLRRPNLDRPKLRGGQ